MARFTFRKTIIAEHIEKIGVDVRPVLEVKSDGRKLQDYALWLVEQAPTVYENIVHGPSSFSITKRFIFPGKGEIEHPTFQVTDRGLVFIFPRKFGVLEEETDLPGSDDFVLEALKHFGKRWPQCKQIRVGKITTYIFDCGPESALEIIATRFTKLQIPASGELSLRLNRPDDDHNRIIKLDPVGKFKLSPDGSKELVGSAVRVEVDFNNRDMSEPLSEERKSWILHEGGSFCEKELFEFLNGEA